MKLNVYSIFDILAEVFNKPFCDHTDASATRSFKASLQENHERNKEDYCLYRIGTFNDNTGETLAEKTPVKVYAPFTDDDS